MTHASNAVLAVFPFLLWVVLVGAYTIRGTLPHQRWMLRRGRAAGTRGA